MPSSGTISDSASGPHCDQELPPTAPVHAKLQEARTISNRTLTGTLVEHFPDGRINSSDGVAVRCRCGHRAWAHDIEIARPISEENGTWRLAELRHFEHALGGAERARADLAAQEPTEDETHRKIAREIEWNIRTAAARGYAKAKGTLIPDGEIDAQIESAVRAVTALVVREPESQEPSEAQVEAARAAFRSHHVEWFPPDPPNSRVPTYVCMGCGWSVQIDGYTEDDRGLDHRIEVALVAAARVRQDGA